MLKPLTQYSCLLLTTMTMAMPSYAVTLRLGDATGNSFDEFLSLPIYLNPENTAVYGFGLEMGYENVLTPAGGIYADNYSDYFVVNHDNSSSVGSGSIQDGQASYIANFDIDEGLQYISGDTEVLIGYMRFEPNGNIISENAYTISVLDDDSYPPRYKNADGDWVTIPIANTSAGSVTLVDTSNFYTGADESNYADVSHWQDGVLPDSSVYAFLDNGSHAINGSVPVNAGWLALGTEQGSGSLSVMGQNVDVVDTIAVGSVSSTIQVGAAMDLSGSLLVSETNSISNQNTSSANTALMIAAPVLGELNTETVTATADVEFKDITSITLSEEIKIATAAATASEETSLTQATFDLDGSLTISEVDSFVASGNLIASDFEANNVAMQGVTIDATSALTVSDITTLFEAKDLKLASTEGLCADSAFDGVAVVNNDTEFSNINRLFLDDDLNIAKTECSLGTGYVHGTATASFKDIASFEGDDDFVIGLIQGGSQGTVIKKATVRFENIDSINFNGGSSDVEIAALEPEIFPSSSPDADNIVSGRHQVEVAVSFKNIPSFFVGDDAYIGQISGLKEDTTLNQGTYTAKDDIDFEQVAMDVTDRVVLGSVSLDNDCSVCDTTSPMPATYNMLSDIHLEQSYIAGGSTMKIATTDPTIVGLLESELTLSNSYLYAPEIIIGQDSQITFNIAGTTQATKDNVLTLTEGSPLIESEALTLAGDIIIDAMASFSAGDYEIVLVQTTNTSAIIDNGITVAINGLDAAENIALAFNETGDKLVLSFTVPAGEVTEPVEEEPETEQPVDETPADETPTDETPADETPADETPADEAPGDDSPADNSSGEAEVENGSDNSSESSSSGGAVNFGFLLMLGALLLLRRKVQI
ncbi:GlyGly-CTERM sorting domain-containing protein [Bacterioplanoides sp.]|uniref:GlyGly-CTERM sorting domain-containing protein n=1 Tax=Bacterioplanoides sp. TaxID=2066072 RepID=UPI003B0081DD